MKAHHPSVQIMWNDTNPLLISNLQERRRIQDICRGVVEVDDAEDAMGDAKVAASGGASRQYAAPTTTMPRATAATEGPASSQKHLTTITPIQIVPPLMQLYPEVEVEHADETSTVCSRAAQGRYTWLFAGRTLYLVCPQRRREDASEDADDVDAITCPHSSKMRVVHSRDVAPMLQLYLREAGKDL